MSRGGRIDPMRFPNGTFDSDDRIDIAIAESFPASDPPSWNGGIDTRSEWRIAEIVAATDLSDCSRNALNHAIALARATGARVTVVHARENAPRYKDLYRSVAAEGGSPPSYADLYADTLAASLAPPVDAQAVAALVQKHHDQLKNVTRVRQAAIAGPPVETILNAAHLATAGLIVVGSHGRHAVAEAFLGSTADAVIRRSGLPVLAVPCDASHEKNGAVVAVLDEPDVADEVLRRASALALVLQAELVPLHVPNDGRVDRRPELVAARMIVIAFPRDERRTVNKSDPNVRVLLRSRLGPILTIPVN